MNKEKLDLFNEYIFTDQEEKGFFNNYKIKEVSFSRYYLDNSYGEAIKKYFDLTKRKSKELIVVGLSLAILGLATTLIILFSNVNSLFAVSSSFFLALGLLFTFLGFRFNRGNYELIQEK